MQQLCDEIIDSLDPINVVDYAQQVALQLPVMVIGEALGVAREDRDRFNRWADAVRSGSANKSPRSRTLS